MAKYEGVRARGKNSIQIRWKHKGKSYYETVNDRPTEANQAKAARYRDRCIELTRRGEYQLRDTTDPIFFEVCNLYLHDKAKHCKQSTLDKDKNRIEHYWSALNDFRISSISAPQLRKLDREIIWPSAKTRNNALSNLKGVFKFANVEMMIDSNPTVSLQNSKHQKKEIDAFSLEEKESLLSKLEGHYQLFYLIMFEIGARTGEVIGMRWSDIQGDTINIKRSIYKGVESGTKTHATRSVIMSDRLIREIAKHTPTRFAGKHIFINRHGEPYKSERALTEVFKRACKDAGVRYRRPYYCRHSYATHSLMKGVNMGFVARQMGDRLETVQQNYASWISGDQDRLEMAKFNS